MRYQIPSDEECVDLLNDAELRLCNNDLDAIRRGRRKAWENYRASGPTGRLRDMCDGKVGDSILLEGYTRSSQLGPIIAAVSLAEGVQLRCAVERSLVDDSVIGVRVTLAAFTR
jgi:hypothetical protein